MSAGGIAFMPGGTIPAGPTSNGQLLTYQFLKVGRYPGGGAGEAASRAAGEADRALGSARPIQIDVRVIAATNRDLDQIVADGTFRKDLEDRMANLGLRRLRP